MAKKKKGKSKGDPEKKAALQAKKELKAEKAARKRLAKEESKSAASVDASTLDERVDDSAALDELLQRYKESDRKSVASAIVESLDNFPAARANASITLADTNKKQELLLFGGEYFDGVHNVVSDQLLLYSLRKNEWKHVITPYPSPPARCAHSSIFYNNAMYIFGGELASADSYLHYKDTWRYDMKEQTWRELKSNTVASKASAPSPRSGHSACLYKHYMVVFGGFYEAKNDAPKWFNDVHVLNLQTEQWIPLPPLSKLAAQPEKRSACNVAVVDDKMIVHGGFSKLDKSAFSTTDANGDSEPVVETKVHTDTWALHLKPLLERKAPTWERLTSSVPKSKIDDALVRKSPNGRSGTSSIVYKDRLLTFGGVMDKEHYHHKVESVFCNDLFAFDVEKRKWFPVRLKQASAVDKTADRGGTSGPTMEQSETVLRNGQQQVGDEGSDSDLEDDQYEENETTTATENKGWDVARLRSNMFAFMDGDGNLVYEKNVDDHASATDDLTEEEKDEEKRDCMGETKVDDSVAKPSPSAIARSVMILNEETKVPEPVPSSEPLPRIKASLVVNGHTLYVYGGLVEVADREVTLDDLWCVDLRKRHRWVCLFEGTMHKQVWRGAVHDDDDSYVSADRATVRDEDEEDGSEDEEDADPQLSSHDASSVKQEVVELKEKYDLGNTDRTPQTGEALASFYNRTSKYWSNLAIANAAGQPELTAKEVKREGFGLARARFEELAPVLERLKELGLTQPGF